jgi:hypothetical protein
VVKPVAVEGVATVPSSTRDEESRCSHSWLEGYIERLEGEKARKEFLDSYEYHEIMATLLA